MSPKTSTSPSTLLLKPGAKPGWWQGSNRIGSKRARELSQIPGVTAKATVQYNPHSALPCVGPVEMDPSSGSPRHFHWGRPELPWEGYLDLPEELRPYQVYDVHAAYSARRFMLNHEMGVGKSAPAAVLASLVPGPALVVCPAMVQRKWLKDFAMWWPDHPEISLVREGAKAEVGDITIVSYDLLAALPATRWGIVILDESHMVKNDKTKRWKAAKALKDHSNQYRLLLTATPITNDPEDLWAQLDWLVPGSFGKKYEFLERYANSEPDTNAYSGVRYFGLHPVRGEELKQRMSYISNRKRTSDPDVAPFMPELRVDCVEVRGRKPNVYKLLQSCRNEGLSAGDTHKRILRAATDAKLKQTVKLVRERREAGAGHIVVLTHLRESARVLAEALGTTHCVTGDLTEKRRHQVLAAAMEEPGSILCATMHSIATGLNLEAFNTVIYAELSYKLDAVTQSMGRFRRASGSGVPVHVFIPVLSGSLEEKIAYELTNKLKGIEGSVGSGLVESALGASFTAEEEDLLSQIAGMEYQEVDGYG